MLKSSHTYVLELDGVTYRFADNQLEQIPDIKDVEGDYWLISDLETAISRTMIVEAEYKYVELMVRKNLQESGEFDGPVSGITHWKRKKGPNATEIFFTALPTNLFHHYQDLIQAHEDSVLLFPLFSILFGVLKKLKPKDPTAIIFQHNRFADLIVGTKKKIYFANRCVSFDTSEEQIGSLWQTIQSDMDTVEIENKIQVGKIITLSWIDSKILPEWPGERECEYFSFEEAAIPCDGEMHQLSFLNGIKAQRCFDSISPVFGKAAYCAKKVVPYVNAACLLAIILLIAGMFGFQQKSDYLSKELTVAGQQISNIQTQQQPLNLKDIDYKNTLAFVQNLEGYKTAPSYKKVVNDLSAAGFSNLEIEVLEMDYVPNAIQAELFGKIDAPFEVAHNGYQRFLRTLKKKGYTIQESRFNTEIRTSHFLMTLNWRIQ